MSPGFPETVKIREVGPRDGFQNEPEVISTEDKVRLIGMLADSGLKRIEVTSFVRPDVIPQLADATEVLEGIEPRQGLAYSVLIPNRKGLENAMPLLDRFQEANFFLSASETHNRKNVNRSVEESLADLEGTIGDAARAGLRCEGVISTSFGCPYEGAVPPERVIEIAKRLAAFGCEELAFGDTTGMANPRQVGEFFARARQELSGAELTAHFHNTRGQGLANVHAALAAGVDSFESSFGELGGCPVPPGATGNIATEDLVSMLEEMGGLDWDRPAGADRVLGRGPAPARPPARLARPHRGAGRVVRKPVRSDRFRAAAEAKDFSSIDELFAKDVTFHSPVVFKPYRGREAVGTLLGAVIQVFEGFRYTDQTETGDVATLAFSARVGRRELDGIDLLRFDEQGRIEEMAVYVRPMSGVNALAEAMRRKLEGLNAAE